ncbi:hypothetical protein TWF506_006172 [Arthrobotrys conoides]|uniref:F-box domain-containing protein n=1 Tax=Arthrobotrys conoides TaxID=74498 RepID=A0AAN8NQH7_9PEZI
MSINILPYEILSKVFENPCLNREDYSNISKVCQRWEMVARPLLLEKLTISYEDITAVETHTSFRISRYIKHYQYVRSLTLELKSIRRGGIITAARISRCFSEITSFQLYDNGELVKHALFYTILDIVISSAPNLKSLSIYPEITTVVPPSKFPEIDYFPGRLSNLKEVTVYIYMISREQNATAVYMRHAHSLPVIDALFTGLLKFLGEGSEDLRFNVYRYGEARVREDPYGIFNQESVENRGWKLRNLRQLSFQNSSSTFGFVSSGVLSADYSMVKYLTLDNPAWFNFRFESSSRSRKSGTTIIVFPNLEVFRLLGKDDCSVDDPNINNWIFNLDSLKYFPRLRYLIFSADGKHMEYPVYHEPNTAADGIASVGPGYFIGRPLGFFPDITPSDKLIMRPKKGELRYEYDELYDENFWS